jgi:hypothetical protein
VYALSLRDIEEYAPIFIGVKSITSFLLWAPGAKKFFNMPF